MPSLLDMDQVAMVKILEMCEFKSILSLQKTCHSLRDFITDSHFKTSLGSIYLEFSKNEFRTSHQLFEDSENFWNLYRDSKLPLSDFNSILALKKVQIGKIDIRVTPDALDSVEKVLKNRPRPLQVENFSMEIKNTEELFQILPNLDSKFLKVMHLRPNENFENLDIDRFLKTEQFNNLKELSILEIPVERSILEFLHLEKLRINFSNTRLDDVLEVKKAFTNSSHMKNYMLQGQNVSSERLVEMFGRPSHETVPGYGHSWAFRIKKSPDFVVSINLVGPFLSFERTRKRDLGGDAAVWD